jgi:hypothetical protein
MCLTIVHKKLRIKRLHLQQLAGPINSKQHTLINLIGLLLVKAIIKGINHRMMIPFEYLKN